MRSLPILLACLATFPCFGQWVKNPSLNTPIVITSTNDYSPVTVPDGAGGSIVLFEKSGVGTGTDVYAQKVNTDGTIAWGTTGTPVLVCNAASEQVDIQAIPDGSGGAFLTWVDWRFSANGEIYCQHINSAGTSLWTANGVRVTTTVSTENKYPYLCSDDAGGIILTWSWDNNVDNVQTSAQRINSAGVPLWTANGVQVCTAPGFRTGQGIIPDGSNGAIISIQDTRNDPNGILFSDYENAYIVNMDVYAQRLSSIGGRMWGDNALAVCTAAGNQDYFFNASIVPDGSGGAVIAFDDGRVDIPPAGDFPTNQNIYAQRLNSSGQPQWTLNGVPISASGGNQYMYKMIADGANGFVLAWGDEVLEGVVSQRINSSGTSLWAASGMAVSPFMWPCYDAALVADGAGNYIYSYGAALDHYNIEAQKLNINGALQWGAAGISVCNATGANPGVPTMVLSDNGGAIIAWRDARIFTTNKNDIYGSKILASGVLAGAVSYTTIANGNWNDPAIWQGGVVPDAAAQVTVRHAVVVTAEANCYSLIVEQPGGNLTVNAGIILNVTH